tara:strand:- start:250 stop:612 length:363 start_codon:yes stop_codon:yes gene_type:complete
MSDELQEWYRMPSIKECLVEYEKQELGLIKDIAVHGCSGGVSGLTYYAETTAFHELHQEEIWQLVGDHADDNGLKNGEFLQHVTSDPGSLTQLTNDLVWYAVEVRAQELMEAAPAAGDPV